ncbi:MAG: hypothetical protein IJV96_00350 [Clostridia bacterium]|nr:hypothetical protein [Clostridia bacterium]
MKRGKFALEFVLILVIVASRIVSYAVEAHRLLVCVLGIIYCFSLLSQIVLSIFLVKHKEFPFGLACSVLIQVFLFNDSTNFNYAMVVEKNSAGGLLITIVGTAILLTATLLLILKKKKVADFLGLFVLNCLVSVGLIGFCVFPTINYTFDMSQAIEIKATVERVNGEDPLKGAFFDRHYLYDIKGAENFQIDQLSIDTDYGLVEKGTTVILCYRKGAFVPLFKIDYSKMPRVDDSKNS